MTYCTHPSINVPVWSEVSALLRPCAMQGMNTTITNQLTTLNTSNLHTGIYFYKVLENNKVVQSEKLISYQ